LLFISSKIADRNRLSLLSFDWQIGQKHSLPLLGKGQVADVPKTLISIINL